MPAGLNKPASVPAPAPKPAQNNNNALKKLGKSIGLPVIDLSPVYTAPANNNNNNDSNPMNNNTRTVTFTKVKETKNTVVFSEDPVKGQPPIIGQLYLQKWFVGDETKVTVNVTIGSK